MYYFNHFWLFLSVFCHIIQSKSQSASPQAIFTSFKLEKGNTATASQTSHSNSDTFSLGKLPLSTANNLNALKLTSTMSHSFDSNDEKDQQQAQANDSLNEKNSSNSFSSNGDSEKVSVVRAAGTFFPQNSGDDDDKSPSKSGVFDIEMIKKAPNVSCEICNQVS